MLPLLTSEEEESLWYLRVLKSRGKTDVESKVLTWAWERYQHYKDVSKNWDDTVGEISESR